MEYNFQIHLSFEQLLQVVLQLPEIDRNRLISALSETPSNKPASWMPLLQMRTVAEILSDHYQYPKTNPKRLIASWQGDETVETLLALRQK